MPTERLQRYDINLIYKQGKHLKVADTVSRAHLTETAEEITEEEMKSQVHLIYANLPCSSEVLEEVKHETSRDSVSQKIMKIIQTSWPRSKKALPEDLEKSRKHKLVMSESEGIVLKDQRILVPIAMRSTILEKLHQGHPGIEKFERFLPIRKRHLIHIQFQYIHGNLPSYRNRYFSLPFNYLLVVDYYSRYWEVVKLRSMTSEGIITEMKK